MYKTPSSTYHNYHSRESVMQTIYPSPQSSTDFTPSSSSSSYATTQLSSLTHPSAPPSPTYAQYYSTSPPTMSVDQFQHQQSYLTLAPYHLTSSSLSLSSSTSSTSSSSSVLLEQRQTSPPPPSYSNTSIQLPLHQDHAQTWGAKLPPLRAIMADQPKTEQIQNRSIWQLPPIQSQSTTTLSYLPIYPY
ncbi:hypothetical protein BC941DRAFT_424445 [Chlamydoabsidia padenii]|nr:hypothetical protein BC941DRAFT_424445 [Chlamydoabsidia padenii]